MPFEPKLYREDQPAHPAKGDAHPLRPPAEPVWDDAHQLDLPDDLAMLAEQLVDDAHYLAERHPADATPAQREAAWDDYVCSSRDKRESAAAVSARWISAAAALAVVIAAGWATFYFATPSPEGRASTASTDRETTAAAKPANSERATADAIAAAETPTTDELPDQLLQPTNSRATPPIPHGQPQLTPAALLRDFTGPELDGMLDLLEEDESGLSI